MKKLVSFSAIPLLAALLVSQPQPREQVGPLPGGGFLLNSGWRLQPAGRQIPLDTFPMASALSRDGKYLLVLHGGFKPPSVSVIDTATAQVVSNAALEDGWLGLAFSPAGDRVYVGGGAHASVYEFSFAGGNSSRRALSCWRLRISAPRKISSATSPSPRMDACSMRPTCITIPS